MGTIFAPIYATPTMGYAEIKQCREIEKRFNITTKYEFLENWKRFLDGFEVFLNADRTKATSLSGSMNLFYPVTQFTMEVSENK